MARKLTFSQAFHLMPICLVGTTDNPKTISDLTAIAEHELTMFEENQDGCVTTSEAAQIRRYLIAISR